MKPYLLSLACFLLACGDDATPPPADAGSTDGGGGTDGGVFDAGPPPTCGSTIGRTCDGDPACNDTCFCNGAEICAAGICTAGADPCDDGIECTVETCSEASVSCDTVLDHDVCSDDDACNGRELCQPVTGCAGGASPECDDGSECTIDSCEPATGCVNAIPDADGDGYGDGLCGGEDCNDDPLTGVMINPAAMEDCGNGFDDDCDGVRDFRDTSCVPTNDACSSATIMPGPGRYSGAMRMLRSDYTLSCGSGGTDAVYRFSIDTPRDVVVTVTGGSMFGGTMTVALRRFDQCTSGPDERCFSATSPVVHARSLPAGEYAVIVKGDSGAIFDVVLDLSDPTPAPRTDVCDGMTLDVSGGGLVTGFFDEARDDYTLSCNRSSGARDVALRFVIPPGPDKDVTISSTGGGFTEQYLGLSTDCSTSAAMIACVPGFGPTSLRRRGLPPGTYYVLLESSDPAAVMWSVRVTMVDAVPRTPGDACSSTLDITDRTASVDVAMMENDGGNSCNPDPSSVDAFFHFDVPAGGADVTVTTTIPGFGFGSSSVSRECGVFGAELQCRNSGSPIVHRWLSLAEGRYYVTGTSGMRGGGFGMMMATAIIDTPPTPIPANDRCAPPPAGSGPTRLTSGTAVRSSLVDYGDDVMTCLSDAPDAYFSIDVAAPSVLTVIASPGTGWFGGIGLSMGPSCADAASIACNVGRPPTPAALSEEVGVGTYIIVVESESAVPAGEFTVTAIVSPL
jgi:hypothetical protein